MHGDIEMGHQGSGAWERHGTQHLLDGAYATARLRLESRPAGCQSRLRPFLKCSRFRSVAFTKNIHSLSTGNSQKVYALKHGAQITFFALSQTRKKFHRQ